jgi:RNA methyltransferase, TrmH family
MMLKISSVQNPKVKLALSLHKASARKKENLFIIEGLREITLAGKAGYRFHSLFVCPEITGWPGDKPDGNSPDAGFIEMTGLPGREMAIEITRDVFAKISYRKESGGLVAIAHQKRISLGDIIPGDSPLILVAEAIEKPGNLGAMIRTADAAGIDAVLVCDPATDLYNPNVIRASLGTLFTTPTVCCSSEDAIRWLQSAGIKIYVTSLSASLPYHKADYTVPSAIVAGSEATGVSAIWSDACDGAVIIPMYGQVDSMNVSVATSVILFEALRQRGCREKDHHGRFNSNI